MEEAFRFVKPLKGVVVRDPTSKSILPESGANVPWVGAEGKYWRRRLRDGTITIEIPLMVEEPKEEIKSFKKYNKE
jgi:hypothetical protein